MFRSLSYHRTRALQVRHILENHEDAYTEGTLFFDLTSY